LRAGSVVGISQIAHCSAFTTPGDLRAGVEINGSGTQYTAGTFLSTGTMSSYYTWNRRLFPFNAGDKIYVYGYSNLLVATIDLHNVLVEIVYDN
jgi:hypothetical protein